MKRTVEMILMTLTLILIAAFVSTTMTSCSNDDESSEAFQSNDILDESSEAFQSNDILYAIITEPNAVLYDIIPQDYVLTLDDIIAYNPETGDMKIKGGDKIAEKSYPIPTQYRISFYLNGQYLFSAWLNNLLSSMIGGTGLMLYYQIVGESGYSYLSLTHIRILDENGNIIDGKLTEQEKQGLKTFENLMVETGKATNKAIEWK